MIVPTSGPGRWWCLEIGMTPLQSQCCSWWWVGGGGGAGGFSWSPRHLHGFESVELSVVKTAPNSQLLNLLSVSRLVTVLDEADQCGVICKLQELDRGVFRCAVVRVERERRAVGREHSPEEAPVLMVWVLNENFPSLTSCCCCLSGSWWSTDRRRWGRRAVSVYSGCPGWWC